MMETAVNSQKKEFELVFSFTKDRQVESERERERERERECSSWCGAEKRN